MKSPHFTVISNAGEREARKIADQFEQFREVFHSTFPKWRLDPGKPLIIFAVKNEDSLKTLIPLYWEAKGRAHPAGIYIPGEERHYVALRTDVETGNPYQIVYHEYTHTILNLNFRALPVWLNEGLAEFFGNSTIYDKEVEIGKIAPYHLRTLRQESLIPIQVVLQADERSPYYNEQNHASMFYAESWAMVHYLMMDPEARKEQLLDTFLKAWDASGGPIESAEKSFGDLKKFSSVLEAYARQSSFYVSKVSTTIHGDPKSFTSRVLPVAELDAERALFYAHTQRPFESRIAVEASLKANPDLALAYEAKGYLAYTQQELAAAKEAFARAIELHSEDYFPYYFAAEAELRDGVPSGDTLPRVIGYLEKAIEMNPQFAPPYAALASVYSLNPATRAEALAVGRKSIELEPGNLSYATNYAYVLANSGKTAEAKSLAVRIEQAAKTTLDRANAQQLIATITGREEYENRMVEMQRRAKEEQSAPILENVEQGATVRDSGPTARPAGSANGHPVDKAPTEAHRGETEYAAEGNVVAAVCEGGQGKVTIGAGKSTLSFRFLNLAAVRIVTSAKQDNDGPPTCANWKGRRVRLYFYKVKEKGIIGEVDVVQFF